MGASLPAVKEKNVKALKANQPVNFSLDIYFGLREFKCSLSNLNSIGIREDIQETNIYKAPSKPEQPKTKHLIPSCLTAC